MKKYFIGVSFFAVIFFAWIYFYLEAPVKLLQGKGANVDRDGVASNSVSRVTARKHNGADISSAMPAQLPKQGKKYDSTQELEIKLDSALIEQVRAELTKFGIHVPDEFATEWYPGVMAGLDYQFLDTDKKPREISVQFHIHSREIAHITDSRDPTGIGFDPWIERNMTSSVELKLEAKVKQLLEAQGNGQVEVEGVTYRSRLETFGASYKVRKAKEANSQAFWVTYVTFDKQTMGINLRYGMPTLKLPEWPMNDEQAVQRITNAKRTAGN